MKKSVYILLLLLAACERGAGGEDNQSAGVQQDLLANLGSAEAGADPAQVQALVDRVMPGALPPGAEPEYRNVRGGVGGAACGEVATSGRNKTASPFRPFVVTPDGQAVIGTEPQIKFNDPSDFLADAWIRWCASPDELKLVEGQLGQDPTIEGNSFAPSGDAISIQAPPPSAIPDFPQPRRPTPASPPPPPPPAQIDSFSKSISRPQ